jgi:hypothetical protein
MGDFCLPEDAALVKKIFSAVGTAFEVKEKDLNGAWWKGGREGGRVLRIGGVRDRERGFM